MTKPSIRKLALCGLLTTSLVLGATMLSFSPPKEDALAVSSAHIVKKGDTLSKISGQYKVSVAHLKQWNHLRTSTIEIGQILQVSNPAASTVSSKNKIHVVKKGDTLSKIAKSHQVSLAKIKQWNKLSTDKILIGQTIKLYAAETTPPPIPLSEKTASLKTVRYYGTNIHVYTSPSHAKLAVSKGTGDQLEYLSQISVKGELAKVNLGMFDFGGEYEHSGMYLINGKHYQETRKRHITMVFHKNGKISIENFGNDMNESILTKLRKNAYLAVGTSYSLVQDGKKNLENHEMYSHSNTKNPRSMFGQLPDGRFIIAVTDGRTRSSDGLTANESANVMLKLGVVQAVNLDGGGSSTLIVNGKIKNKLSGGQRKIGSALFITK